ncbi:MAG: hypothetical protein COV52_06225 [Gammaproteobacteria bacterium CG11_big_fil_rev_8_21_14_0_20_46_22]|nr:MAG: hypothetical protein COW05_07435 [Gammaproteobacteria bacterium CG12_big_fil_rev_8_21_14_0_65_46_12]PIR11099.1 MAG: hypothetical protein COV52_06225 [Gammaproteobacteria bacterium CG11_big_fil_rev_8_21_14_0_20_46_22]
MIHEPLIEEMGWEQARELAKKGCKELLSIIDEINPDKELTLIKVRYPFGSIIVQDDVLHLPIDNKTTAPINDIRIDRKWQAKLKYCSIPMGIIIKNSLEVYREIDEKVFSVALSGPNTGIEMGPVEHFGSTAAYTVSSGARSLFMVPRISKATSHKKLRREFGVASPAPKRLVDHWQIFKEIYASENFGETWECELLFLTKKWDEHLKKNYPHWLKLKCYIRKKAWEHSELGRRKVMLDVVWQQASGVLTRKGLKPDPYVVDTLKHLIFIALGGISGSRPANGDDFAGPLNKIQEIYTDIYGLENQIPTIMRPYSFSSSEGKPVYYSMQTPMLLSSTPNFRNMSSNIEDMRELINTKQFVFEQDYGNLKIDNTKFNDLIGRIKFNYFHGEMYAYGQEIRPTKEIPLSDPDFLYTPQKNNNGAFADNGAYIRGCIKISKK